MGGGSFSSFYLGALGVRGGWMGAAVMSSGVRGCEAKQAAWAEKLGKAGRRKKQTYSRTEGGMEIWVIGK